MCYLDIHALILHPYIYVFVVSIGDDSSGEQEAQCAKLRAGRSANNIFRMISR